MRLLTLLLFVVSSVGAAAAAEAPTVEVRPDGRVLVRASGVPLGQLLLQVSRQAPLGGVYLDPGVADTPINLEVEARPLAEVLLEIAVAAGANYIVGGDRIYVGDPANARLLGSGAGSGDETWLDGPAAKKDGKAVLEETEGTRTEGGPPPADEEGARADYEYLFSAMQPQPQPTDGLVELPFPGPDGSPGLGESRRSDGLVTLPFPGPDGRLRTIRVDPEAPKLSPLDVLPRTPAPPPPPEPAPPVLPDKEPPPEADPVSPGS